MGVAGTTKEWFGMSWLVEGGALEVCRDDKHIVMAAGKVGSWSIVRGLR